VLVVAGIDDPKLDSTARPHSSSWSHILPHRIVCHARHPAPTIMGGLVLWLRAHASFTSIVIHWSAVCFSFGYGYGRKRAISFSRGFGYGHNWISVTAPLLATAETRKTGFGRSLVVATSVSVLVVIDAADARCGE